MDENRKLRSSLFRKTTSGLYKGRVPQVDRTRAEACDRLIKRHRQLQRILDESRRDLQSAQVRIAQLESLVTQLHQQYRGDSNAGQAQDDGLQKDVDQQD